MSDSEFEDLGFPWSMAAMTHAVLSEHSSPEQYGGQPYCRPDAGSSANQEPSVQAEVRELFGKIWRELQGREKAAPSSDLGRTKVWLECNGELIDTGSVAAVGTREPVPGVELINFVCPRCGKCHESLRFR